MKILISIFLNLLYINFTNSQNFIPPPIIDGLPSPSKHEPPHGFHYLGAWLDTQANSSRFETPQIVNARLGLNMPLYQFAQNIPVGDTIAPIQELMSETDALLLLSIYAVNGLTNNSISDEDLEHLARQCAQLNKEKRRVIVRYCPEMNGGWTIYGQKPTEYKAQWIRFAKVIRIISPETALLWSPNSAAGYPFAGGMFTISPGDLDFKYLDTNDDGLLTIDDEPYLPYYPGDEWVDWVGMSIYYYGNSFPWIKNEIPPLSRYADILTGIYAGPGLQSSIKPYNFYEEFSIKRNKPFFGSETSAAFHTSHITPPIGPISEGPGNLAIKQGWWRQQILNASFLELYPKIKGFCLFEFEKSEEETFRDFKVLKQDEFGTLNEFRSDLAAVVDLYIWANSTLSQKITIGNTDYTNSNLLPSD
ncbi:hypothetical protein HK096_009116, partial [Nowakowskiella sp. JEL0078]